MNVETLSHRLQKLLNLYDANFSQPAVSAETPFNCLGGASRSDSVCNNAFIANNADDVNLIKGGPFEPSIINIINNWLVLDIFI